MIGLIISKEISRLSNDWISLCKGRTSLNRHEFSRH